MVDLPLTSNENKHILVFTCMMSKWIEAFAIPNKSAELVGKIFHTNIICRYGTP